ncbi:putative neural-cadherin 2 isoform X1 [Portunus trituberculatus]|uniref:putative neural-cadherin 2 isoform X1 n=1 Tax=Portunus trituberculatus TaxID=210409 RepID=UPI001E1D1D65|nr:putative neural-cadherin 2 isoform X1 [Portunus trituberculatus]
MAVNVLMPLLIPLGEQITNVTHLAGRGSLIFSQPLMEVFVQENTAPVLLLTLHATSNTTASDVVYSVVSGAAGGLFHAHPHTGHLTLTAPLDYEAYKQYDLVVGGQAGEERAFARVFVRVKDQNDLPPAFPRPVFETQITEEDDRHLPKAILQVIAEDGDISDEGRLLYSLSTDDHHAPINTTFSISRSSGYIHLLRPLDRDAPLGRARWRLWVAATDGLHTARAQVHVNVKDINDNAPFFPHNVIEASVLENADAGTEVAHVTATDLDDPEEGANAAVTYSVDKNVIDEQSGRPIFSIDSATGTIRTALCCLDREQTPSFVIQVVASDGGGLKGTGTVVVALGDENDVSPKFSRREWVVTVPESVTPNTSLALLSVRDLDTTNDFAFKVVSGSGYGWERFAVVPAMNHSGALQTLNPLDYEDPSQRRGFKFKIQVSDQGEAGWQEARHMDSAWVRVLLLDDNDNAPRFATNLVNLTLPEDTPLGHSLASFTATDIDQDGLEEIHYAIDPASDPGRQFAVDSEGRVWLRRLLDRETAASHAIRVWAVDGGQPARTATATLLLPVLDVNDNPPHVAGPAALHVPENSWPRHVANVTLGDADDWTLGHGPPFTVVLDTSTPAKVREDFAVDFDSRGDEGRGVAVVTSLRPLDREAEPTRLLPLVVGDARGLTATVTITVTVTDVNDNLMSSAAKVISVTRITGQVEGVSLGRVYVADPDDWDAGQKTWEWRRRIAHPLFTLDPRDGHLALAPHASDGSYFLQFWVSDATHGQTEIPANVTVYVTSLSEDVMPWAVPVTLATHSPEQLLSRHQGSSISQLEALVDAVESLAESKVVVVSLEEQRSATVPTHRTSRVWLAARPRQPLDQLLLLHRHQIAEESGVVMTEVGVGVCLARAGASGVWVVDANRTALVTPRFLTVASGCSCRSRQPQILQQQYQEHREEEQLASVKGHQPSVAAVTRPTSCQPSPCLNHGRCIAKPRGPRCVCPQGTSGSICKQLSRRFAGDGWAWVSPVPSCPSVHITLEFRARCSECLLLYAGPAPASAPSPHFVQEDVLSVELRDGWPRVMLDLGTSPVLLTTSMGSTSRSPSLADDRWHRLDIMWGNERAEMVVDTCNGGEGCHVGAALAAGVGGLKVMAPLQVGGMAHAPPRHLDHGWPAPIASSAFHGCIRNLRVNGELRDLGEEVLSAGSWPGCTGYDICPSAGHRCSDNSRCVEEVGCVCNLGWTGPSCSQLSSPASFSPNSYIKMALSSSPPTSTTTLQLRFRTWEASGQLLAVTSHHERDQMVIHLAAGHLCVQLTLHPRAKSLLCLSRSHLSDGRWHSVTASRHGEWLELLADEGDGLLYNTTATPSSLYGWTAPLLVDRHEGVHVGGSPEYVGVSLQAVHSDFRDGCLDDLRVSGISLPLPPRVNITPLAEVTMFTNVRPSCLAPAACANVTCSEPLTCVDVWRRHECGCGEGAALVRETGTCRDVNECLWSPCFNGGTCINHEPGYMCLCPEPFTGEHCTVSMTRYSALTLSFSALVLLLVFSCVILGMVLAVYMVCQQRKRKFRQGSRCSRSPEVPECPKAQQDKESGTTGNQGGDVSTTKTVTELHHPTPSTNDTEEKSSGMKAARKSKSGAGGEGGCGCPHLPSLDDLRYYAYEGDGSSPGSLSSCCSGADGAEEAKLIGGFQDVATLLNCLTGQSAGQSPGRRHSHVSKQQKAEEVRSTLTPFNISYSKADGAQTSPSEATKEGPDDNNTAPVITDYDTGIHASLIYRKCNSLPRSRAPKIFVNNLHNFSRSPERNLNSLQKSKTIPTPCEAHAAQGCHTERKCCKTSLSSPSRGGDLSPARAGMVCLACSATAHTGLECQHGGGPRRSKSFSTVSYITAGLSPGRGCPCPIARSAA